MPQWQTLQQIGQATLAGSQTSFTWQSNQFYLTVKPVLLGSRTDVPDSQTNLPNYQTSLTGLPGIPLAVLCTY